MKTGDLKIQNVNRKKIEPVYLIAGPEDFLIQRATQKIQKASIVPGTEDFNLDILYGNETDGSQIVNIAMSYPMMAERRTVIVKNMHLLSTSAIDVLVKYVQKPSSTTCLILTAQKLDFRKSSLAKIKSKSIFIEAKSLYDNQVADWIRSFASEQNLKITDDAIRLLHASTGSSLRRISTEFEKIKLNLFDKKLIEIADVERVVGVSREYNVFDFCDAIGSKKTAKSLKILGGMLQLGEIPSGLLAMLNRHFTIISKLQELKRQKFKREQIAKKLRINPYFIDNYSRQAGLFSFSQIAKVFELLLEADFQLKTSYQKPKLVMELLLIKLGSLN